MKLIKLQQDHFIIVDDSEIKEKSGDWFYSFETGKIYDTLIHHTAASCKKITHSTQPLEYTNEDHLHWNKIKQIYLSEVKELIGEVDVEKKVEEVYPQTYYSGIHIDGFLKAGYVKGYNQALEDNKEKKYTEEDLRKMFDIGEGLSSFNDTDDNKFKYALKHIQPKTEWEVEIVDGKLKLK